MSIVVLLLVGFVCGKICQSISKSRGMDGGFWWGFCLGIIGIIIVAVRPNDKTTPSTTYVPPPTYAQPATNSSTLSSSASIEGGWRCAFCGKLNYSYEARCSCGRSRWDTSEPKKNNTPSTIKCLQCGADNKSDSKFCSECGANIQVPRIIKCPNCGKENEPSSKFCNECGTDLLEKKKVTLENPMKCINVDSEYITLFCNSCGRVTRFPSSYFTHTESGEWIADYKFVCPGCENSIPKGYKLTEKDAEIE